MPVTLVKDLEFEPVADMCGGGRYPWPRGRGVRRAPTFLVSPSTVRHLHLPGRQEVRGAPKGPRRGRLGGARLGPRQDGSRKEKTPQGGAGLRAPVELFSHFEGGPTLRLRLTDISRKGVGFIGVHDVNENDEGIFAVLLPGEGNIVISPGTVRFKKSCGDFFRYGVELLVSPRDEQKIERYVLERERETAETAEDE